MHPILNRARRLVAGSHPAPRPASGTDHIVTQVLSGLARHRDRYAESLGAPDLTPYELRVFSQNGEDGVIGEILRRIGVTNRWFVEFGIGTGHQGNAVLLADAYAWSGLFCEPDASAFPALARKYSSNPLVAAEQVSISPANVEEVFERHGVPLELDLLSIDVDTIDYWIWGALTTYRPRLVVVEYNSTLDMDRVQVFPNDAGHRWDETVFYGSSLGAFISLGRSKGYQLVHTEMNGVNAFFVRGDLADAVGVKSPPKRRPNFGLVGAEMPPDPHQRKWIDSGPLPSPPEGGAT